MDYWINLSKLYVKPKNTRGGQILIIICS